MLLRKLAKKEGLHIGYFCSPTNTAKTLKGLVFKNESGHWCCKDEDVEKILKLTIVKKKTKRIENLVKSLKRLRPEAFAEVKKQLGL